MWNADQISGLLMKHLQGDLNAQEQQLLEEWRAQSPNNRYYFQQLQQPENLRSQILSFHPEKTDATEKAIFEKIKLLQAENAGSIAAPRPVQWVHPLRRWWVAASVMLLICGGAYFWYQEGMRSSLLTKHYNTAAIDINPGRQGAILTLADGTEVVLDSLENGFIAMQNGTQVVLKGEQLVYARLGKHTRDITYNTMRTPKGRQFTLLLPDGSKVWLNAASTIRYPTIFTGKERSVDVTGEAYFEIAQNAKQPFKVNLNGQAEVEVLGTHFNVNAYADEKSVYTTLLEGAVSVSAIQQGSSFKPAPGAQTAINFQRATPTILKPGQQAQITVGEISGQQQAPPSNAIKVINDPDTEKIMAWKNGAFNFNNTSLKDVMKQLERWYDIEVVYKEGIPDIYFVGEMSRDESLASVLKGLEASKVHFRIEEGRRLVVMP